MDIVMKNLMIGKYSKHGLIMKDGKYYKSVSLSQPLALVIELADDEMDIVIECPHCKRPTKYGETRMSSGYVGCDNILTGNYTCYDEVRNMDIERHKHYGE